MQSEQQLSDERHGRAGAAGKGEQKSTEHRNQSVEPSVHSQLSIPLLSGASGHRKALKR